MATVVTTNGTLLQRYPPGVDPKTAPPLTQEQAEVICTEANGRAEALGIETRYEVKED